MKKDSPKRIAIIGLPGSGKSTFATKLGKLLDIPVHHLDKHVFEEGGKKKDHQEFVKIQQEMLDGKSWIIEGCSIRTLEMRFMRADAVIYFQLPPLSCVWRLFKRSFTLDKDLADTGCVKIVNWMLLKYTWNFDKEKGERIEELKSEYPNLDFHLFQSSQDADKFLEKSHREKCLLGR